MVFTQHDESLVEFTIDDVESVLLSTKVKDGVPYMVLRFEALLEPLVMSQIGAVIKTKIPLRLVIASDQRKLPLG